MELKSRHEIILAAVVSRYIETGEPVGSKAVVESLDGTISSATVRNYMAALEDMDLLVQPHTSAGRIPTSAGIRYYVNNIMQYAPLDSIRKSYIDNYLKGYLDDIGSLIDRCSDLLSELTGYTGIITTPQTLKSTIISVNVVKVSDDMATVSVVISGGKVQSLLCKCSFSETDIAVINSVLKDIFKGTAVSRVDKEFLKKACSKFGDFALMIRPILECAYQLIAQLSDETVHQKGAGKLLSHHEISSHGADLLKFFDSTSTLNDLFKDADSIGILVGDELTAENPLEISAIYTGFNYEGDSGAVAIVGPVRMDYHQMVAYIDYFGDLLGRLLSE